MFVSKSTENGLVGREEIAKVVKGLICGEEGAMIRDRINILKERAPKSLSILNHLCLHFLILPFS